MKAIVPNAGREQRLLAVLSTFAVLTACFALGSAKARAATCPNEAIREAQVSDTLPQGTTFLPNCMALELVSPPKKFNQYAERPNFSANGERVKFVSLAALAETPKLGSIVDPYIATRTPSGWVTEATSGPPDIVAGSGISAIACVYSSDLSHWALFGSTATQESIGIVTAFRGGTGGVFGPLSPTMVPLTGDFGSFAIRNSSCAGGSADVSHFFFAIKGGSSGASYLPGDPIPPDAVSALNVYEAYLNEGTPSLALLQRDKDGVVYGGNCGAAIGGDMGNVEPTRGAVSPDASRVYFTTNPGQPEGEPCDANMNGTRIMLREQTADGPVISELVSSECTRVAPPCTALDSNEDYLGASQEGERVFFTSARQLANTDIDTGTDLYLHDASLSPGQRLTQVSAGDDTAPTPGEGAGFLGLAEYSGDGSHAYFVAKDILTTTQNEAGETAQAGEPNLYLYQRDGAYPAGRTVFIATLATADAQTWNSTPGEKNRAMAVPRLGPDPEDLSTGGDGRVLVFQSTRALNAGDTDGGKADLYRYDSVSAVLARVSAASPGGEDSGPFAATTPLRLSEGFVDDALGPTGPSFNRWVSEGGETIVFLTAEKLDPLDPDNAETPYIWHQGELTPLPFPSEQPVVSMAGDSVAFVIGAPLLPEDGDGTTDVYVARANGGYPIIAPPAPCAGEACQGAPAPKPAPVSIASQSQRTGNVRQAPCRKGQARKRGRCVKKQKRQRKGKKAGKTNRKQGGRK